MANTKISALTSGSPAQVGDLIPIARGGNNYALAAKDFLNVLPAPGTSIVYKSSTSSSSATANVQTATVSIAQGDTIVVVVNGSTGANAIIGDDGGNSYSGYLATATQSGFISIYAAINVPRSATVVRVQTGFGTGNVAFAVAVYSGAKSIATYTSTTTGTSTTAGISLTSTVANSFMVAGIGWFKSGTAISASANTGNLRTTTASSASATVTGIAIVDNTQAALASETCSVTLSVAPTGAQEVAIELIPA